MTSAQTGSDAASARRCVRGLVVAEELTTGARELVVAWLHVSGATDQAIAARTAMTTYTAWRIRARLGLPVNS